MFFQHVDLSLKQKNLHVIFNNTLVPLFFGSHSDEDMLGFQAWWRCLFPLKTKSVNIMSSGDTRQPSSVILTTSCVIQGWHVTVCKVDQNLRERLLSSAAVRPVIGAKQGC